MSNLNANNTGMEVGDTVCTTFGFLGQITEVQQNLVVLHLGLIVNCHMTVERDYIASFVKNGTGQNCKIRPTAYGKPIGAAPSEVIEIGDVVETISGMYGTVVEFPRKNMVTVEFGNNRNTHAIMDMDAILRVEKKGTSKQITFYDERTFPQGDPVAYKNIEVGDYVVTAFGIMGQILDVIDDETAVLEFSSKDKNRAMINSHQIKYIMTKGQQTGETATKPAVDLSVKPASPPTQVLKAKPQPRKPMTEEEVKATNDMLQKAGPDVFAQLFPEMQGAQPQQQPAAAAPKQQSAPKAASAAPKQQQAPKQQGPTRNIYIYRDTHLHKGVVNTMKDIAHVALFLDGQEVGTLKSSMVTIPMDCKSHQLNFMRIGKGYYIPAGEDDYRAYFFNNEFRIASVDDPFCDTVAELLIAMFHTKSFMDELRDKNTIDHEVRIDVHSDGIRCFFKKYNLYGIKEKLDGGKTIKYPFAEFEVYPPPANYQPGGYWAYVDDYAKSVLAADQKLGLARHGDWFSLA